MVRVEYGAVMEEVDAVTDGNRGVSPTLHERLEFKFYKKNKKNNNNKQYKKISKIKKREKKGMLTYPLGTTRAVTGACACVVGCAERGVLPYMELLPIPFGVIVPEVVPGCVRASRIHACFSPSSGVILSFASHLRHPSKKSKNNL